MDKHTYVAIRSVDEKVESPLSFSHDRKFGFLHATVTIFLGTSTIILAALLYFKLFQASCHEKWSTYCKINSILYHICFVDAIKLPYCRCCRRSHRFGSLMVHSVIALRTKDRQTLLLMQLGTIYTIQAIFESRLMIWIGLAEILNPHDGLKNLVADTLDSQNRCIRYTV